MGFSPPGAASRPQQGEMEGTGYDAGTDAIGITYVPACDATDHTIHHGPLSAVRSYGWAAAQCGLGGSGVATFTPDPLVGESPFWVIVGNDASYEGTYGTSSAGVEIPQSTAAGVCTRVKSLASVCQ